MELRCPSKLHGVLVNPSADEGTVEFKCSSRWCGAGPEVVVLHQFSTQSGKLTDTRKFRQPRIGGADAS